MKETYLRNDDVSFMISNYGIWEGATSLNFFKFKRGSGIG